MMRFIVQQKKKTKKILWAFLAISLILIYMFWIIETHLKPSILAIAEAKTGSTPLKWSIVYKTHSFAILLII